MSTLRASHLGEEADPSRTRLAGRLDGVAALVITMLAWPFPVLRASLSWEVHIPLILVAILLSDTLLRTISLMVWGRTPMMYLLDLGLVQGAERIGVGKAFAWAFGWTLSLLPTLLGVRVLSDPAAGIPARLSGLVTRSTA